MTFSDVSKNPAEWGRVIESAVGAYLANESLKGSISLFYWRDRNDEVDFVIERDGKIIGIEVKSTTSRNNRGMTSFQKKYHPFRTICIDENRMPWKEFIRLRPSELF